jgi:hypothetical protein
VPKDFSDTSNAAAALNRLMLGRVITRYETNFESVRVMGSAPEVHVWIKGQDELGTARARKRVKDALYPFLKASITVSPEPLLRRDNCGND